MVWLNFSPVSFKSPSTSALLLLSRFPVGRVKLVQHRRTPESLLPSGVLFISFCPHYAFFTPSLNCISPTYAYQCRPPLNCFIRISSYLKFGKTSCFLRQISFLNHFVSHCFYFLYDCCRKIFFFLAAKLLANIAPSFVFVQPSNILPQSRHIISMSNPPHSFA